MKRFIVLLSACLACSALALTGCKGEVVDQPDVPGTDIDNPSEGTLPDEYHIIDGIDLDRIAAAQTTDQIVVVQGNGGTDCHVIFAQKTANGWECIVSTDGHVGKNGIDVMGDNDEWSVKTPEGVWGLGFAFGIKENPGTAMEYRQVTENDYWVADPDSDYYNQWVDISKTGKVWADGSQTEHLIDYTVPYAYCIFIQYNWPVEGYARSSAIFLHCIGNSYTGGCVSIPEADMVTVLQHIKAEGAVIVIANGDDIYKY